MGPCSLSAANYLSGGQCAWLSRQPLPRAYHMGTWSSVLLPWLAPPCPAAIMAMAPSPASRRAPPLLRAAGGGAGCVTPRPAGRRQGRITSVALMVVSAVLLKVQALAMREKMALSTGWEARFRRLRAGGKASTQAGGGRGQ
jgi:hypothetical protein